ncbi:MAG: hypothetical protein FGM23_06305 [Alphaproteobacteria bacterium]|jgi:hypothetical protein|nr:hypothetical protein [Alphaproteobacteria bacterium]
MQFNRDYFLRVHEQAMPFLPAILRRVLPQGKVDGHEYVALNPRRADSALGSFKINLLTGKWADFAVNASGGDVTSLVAYILCLSQSDAALAVLNMIGGAP